MRNLRKFTNEEKFLAWRKSTECVTPNLVLVGASIKYNVPTLYGVSIQHIDGTLYTIREWQENGFTSDDANGVAIVDDRASFVVAKEDIGEKLLWSNEAILVEGVSEVSHNLNGFADCMNGVQDTKILVELGVSPAASACAEYTFPNGSKGYLPSAGEWEVFNSYDSSAKEAFNLIGGADLFSPSMAKYYWSTTQKNASDAWAYASRMGIQYIYKNTLTEHSGNTRAFCTL